MPTIWLITGASRGLGRALADAVVAAGHMLVATARNPAQLADLAQRAPNRIRTVALDVTDATAAERAIQTARDAFGRLDVLVNNAAEAAEKKDLERIEADRQWRDLSVSTDIQPAAALAI
jgi:NADP-dependent 3-hydroxy acid dehydrogenase YdfG